MIRRPLLLGVLILLVVCAQVDARQPGSGSAETSDPQITFLDRSSAKQAIVDETLQPYFSLLLPTEMSAKTGSKITGDTLEEMRAECRRRYQQAVAAFSKEEEKALGYFVKQLQPALENYPVFAKHPWSFLKTDGTVEGGLPHTRGDHIVLSAPVVGMLTMMQEAGNENATRQIGMLLIHEQCHVVQRHHPELFRKLYGEVWDFDYAQNIEGCAWLDEQQLKNPDGVDCRWIFPISAGEDKRWILPLVVFAEKDGLRKMPADFRMVALELEPAGTGFKVRQDEAGKPVFESLHAVSEYTRSFPGIGSVYHPNEISADLFAELVLAERFDGSPENLNKHHAGFVRWAKEHLGKKK